MGLLQDKYLFLEKKKDSDPDNRNFKQHTGQNREDVNFLFKKKKNRGI
jgi:hypothetical protein